MESMSNLRSTSFNRKEKIKVHSNGTRWVWVGRLPSHRSRQCGPLGLTLSQSQNATPIRREQAGR